MEPIAIVGLGCRLPGDVNSPADLWEFLRARGQAAVEVPAERWAGYPEGAALGKATRLGGYLTDAAAFDADFFGITPREAELMDPQQRIVLEVAWEALEHAGIAPTALAGTDAGVFVGVGSDDYGRRMLEDLPGIEAWTGIGASMCAVANRVSYLLDLRGPSMAVDTACSASLVAIHLACQSLRAGESTVALAGGVNIVAGPGLPIVLGLAGATSPDGRSKSFDASADGYGRGEGAGVIVLKRLSDARRDGDRVLAVIRGSAVNQDGRTNGIMAPSGEAQEYVVRQALRQAGLDPATIGFVEAHGTGTRMGDPIEVNALSAVYGAGRAAPCALGSLKANIGHLEAGAGVAGVIKAVLALHHEEIPPNVGFTEGNPAIDWDACGLRVVTEPQAWPAGGQVRRAAVSSFGYGGTVAHVVLEEGDRPAPPAPGGDEPQLMLLSAPTEPGLRAAAARLADWLAGPGDGAPLDAVADALAARRAHLPCRAAVLAEEPSALIQRLRHLAADDDPDGVVTGRAGTTPADPVWVFSGHGSQWVGMGRELLATDPAFAAVIDELAEVFQAELGIVPREVIGADDLGGVDHIQPMIYAIQVALAESWRTRGVVPGAVIGHSVGEIAAAVAAGVFDRRHGATLVCRRSALLASVAGQGAMAMVSLPFAEVEQRLTGRGDVVAAIAAATCSTVVSGTPDAVAQLSAQWQAEGVTVRKVASDVAFHSPQMDPLLAGLATALAELRPVAPTVPLYSAALADPRSDAVRDAAYWVANLRNPVRFDQAVAAAATDGHRLFLEISAHPVVTHSAAETLSTAGITDATVTGTLRRGRPEREAILTALGQLHCHGARIVWPATAHRVDLPTAAWQHRRYWRSFGTAAASGRRHDPASHTLLGGELAVAGSAVRVWQTRLDEDSRPYPGGHPIHSVEIVPAAVLMQTFLSASGAPVLADLRLRTPVPVTPREVQVVADGDTLRLASRTETDDTAAGNWLLHTTARAGAIAPSSPPQRLRPADLRERYPIDEDPGAVVRRLNEVGVADVGFPWRIEELRHGDQGLAAWVTPEPGLERPHDWASLLDAILSFAPMAVNGAPVLRMPSAVARFCVAGPVPALALVEVVQRAHDDEVDVLVADPDGRIVAWLEGLRMSVLEGDPAVSINPTRLVLEIGWEPVALAAARPERAVLVGPATPLAKALTQSLTAGGVTVLRVPVPDDLPSDQLDAGAVVVLPGPDGADPADHAWALARTAQVLARAGHSQPAALWSVTTGLREADPATVAQSPRWGLGRVIAGEHPELWGGQADLPAVWTPADVGPLVDLLGTRPGEDVLSVRDGAVAAARLQPLSGDVAVAPLRCRADATYLITGGLGVLGAEVAAWLVGKGARRIVLAARTGLPPRSGWDAVTDPAVAARIATVRGLEEQGATVAVVAVDIADEAAVRAALDTDVLGLPPIRGIVHAAGVLDNRMLGDLDESSLRHVLRPKAGGLSALGAVFPPGSLDFLALFSSNGLLLGLTGQAAYASANAYLDGWSRARRAAGADDVISFGWTSWRGMGMAVNSVVDQELADRGVGDITPAQAFAAWDHAAGSGRAHVAVMRTVPATAVVPPLLRGLAVEPAAAETADEPLSGLDGAELHTRLMGEVAGYVGAEVRLPLQDLDVRRPLTELGLDSVMTLVIRRKLERRFRLNLPATLLWNHPTITDVAHYLATRLEPADQADDATEGEPTPIVVGG
ncbi:acyltransferase domain-containing protein [Catellatospora citrea]|uniref:type I polyketide synthase n=1 Tax=Catellatospora citrea TaxID=53366 RepID=UPI0033FCDF56